MKAPTSLLRRLVHAFLGLSTAASTAVASGPLLSGGGAERASAGDTSKCGHRVASAKTPKKAVTTEVPEPKPQAAPEPTQAPESKGRKSTFECEACGMG